MVKPLVGRAGGRCDGRSSGGPALYACVGIVRTGGETLNSSG
jgi:hypothetical protein